MTTLTTWTLVVIPTFGLVGIIAGAVAVVRSRYREATDAEREKYIAALESRNKLLEEEAERRDEEMKSMAHKHHNLEGKVCVLQDLILRQCRRAEIDPSSGGCRHCDVHMAYGQKGAL